MSSLLDNLENDEPSVDNGSGKKKKKGIFRKLGEFVSGKGNDDSIEEEEDASIVVLPSIKVPSAPSKPSASKATKASDLESWSTNYITKYDANIVSVQALQNDLKDEIAQGDVTDIPDVSHWVHQAFSRDIVADLRHSIQQNTTTAQKSLPPALRHHHHPYTSSDYNFLTNIEGKPYQLRIVSRLPVEAFSYTKGEYLKAYQQVKSTGRWCFPDRRLQGIPQLITDDVALSFRAFEEVFLKKVHNVLENENLREPDDVLLILFALGFVSDRVPVAVLPKIEKVLDVDAAEGDKRKITIVFGGEIRVGEEDVLWGKIADNARSILLNKGPATLFEKNTIDPMLVIAASKNQLFDLDETVIKKAIDSTYKLIEDSLNSDLTTFTDEASELEIYFRTGVMRTILTLSVQLKLHLEKKNKPAGASAIDIPPTPLEVFD